MSERILITNDDGIESPGIRRLAKAVQRAGHDVVVAAPMTEASGSSASMTAIEEDGKIVVEPRELTGARNVPAYGVAATPAFIVLLALREAFGEAPAVVLSGINRGANAGAAIIHSGTVGATLTAAHAGLRGMAVSLDVLAEVQEPASSEEVDDEKRHWASAAELAVKLLPVLAHTPAGTVLNLNVPDLHVDGIRGLRRASLARFGQVQVSIAERTEGFVRTAVQAAQENLEPGTDLAALAEGYASVTPLRSPSENRDVRLNLESIRVRTPAL